jgi:hypothetical protein
MASVIRPTRPSSGGGSRTVLRGLIPTIQPMNRISIRFSFETDKRVLSVVILEAILGLDMLHTS